MALGGACAPAGAATALPHVVGPIPVTAASYPFGVADHTLVPEDLSKVGYVEEEYFVSGKANVYTCPAAGPAVARTPHAPYTTRILLRRPARASRFSGNVVVEMLNPSNQFDLNIGWAMAHRQMVRHGGAWLGTSHSTLTPAPTPPPRAPAPTHAGSHISTLSLSVSPTSRSTWWRSRGSIPRATARCPSPTRCRSTTRPTARTP